MNKTEKQPEDNTANKKDKLKGKPKKQKKPNVSNMLLSTTTEEKVN